MKATIRILLTTLLFCGLVGSPTVLALNQTDTENILFLKQEEKLARDVYLALLDIWGHQTFVNISESEQRHMDAVDQLIARYELTDTTPEDEGKFTFPVLQQLYNDLVDWGSLSLADALLVGVEIEEMDIEDIQAMIDVASKPSIIRVMTNLLEGSHNHLDAFNRALERLED